MVVKSEVGTDTMNRAGKPLQVGLYEIIRTLGKGNFAVVKLARHKITRTQVAIKIIDKSQLKAPDLQKLNREVTIMKLLKHPHIIRLYQIIETQSMLYIVTEYAANGEMFNYLACNGHLSEEQARKTFWQILSAVEYCHKYHIVHRDLKAENLLLDSNMNIKLADFGFGNFIVPGKLLNTWCGSPPYAAPEIFKGNEYEGPQQDIWSLGVVLYVLVCGSLPFEAVSLPVLKQRVLEGRFRIPHFMSQECGNLIRRMLVVDPAKRISLAQIKQHCWMKAAPTTACQTLLNPSETGRYSPVKSYNEKVLGLMQTLGLDKQMTVESLQNDRYNEFSAIYWLLLEKRLNGQEQLKKDGFEKLYTPPVLGNSWNASSPIIHYRNSSSNLTDAGVSRVARVKNIEEVKQLPLDSTTGSRIMTHRHTGSEASSPNRLCQPPSQFGLNKVPTQNAWPPMPNPEHMNKPPTQSWGNLYSQTSIPQHHHWARCLQPHPPQNHPLYRPSTVAFRNRSARPTIHPEGHLTSLFTSGYHKFHHYHPASLFHTRQSLLCPHQGHHLTTLSCSSSVPPQCSWRHRYNQAQIDFLH